MSIPIPLDNDGFLRRECPTCGREFKWHDGPANEEAEVAPVVDVYYCPLCGAPAGPDDWWTQSQLDFIHGNAAPLAMRQMGDMLADAFKGVKGVNNSIKLEPKAKPSEIKRKIQEAFRRNAEVDSNRIVVDADGSVVTLKGTVRSWTEREEAERAAWAAPGVTSVIDQIVVSP